MNQYVQYREMDKKKGYVVECLCTMGCAQADVIINKLDVEDEAEVDHSSVDETFIELQKWTDLNDSKVTCPLTLPHGG